MDIEDMLPDKPRPKSEAIKARLRARRAGTGLFGEFFHDEQIYRADLEIIWHKEWIFAGLEVELPNPGSWLTLQIGDYPVFVMRGKDGVVRGFHNTCRHRGFKLCEGTHGTVENQKRGLVCSYHNWTYDIDSGNLRAARDMDDDFDPLEHGLMPVATELLEGYIFVSLAESPPDFSSVQKTFGEYLKPYDLKNCKVAHQSRIVEKGNWKLVWENNRECYHCAANHPELTQSFPANWVQSTEGDYGDHADR